MFQFARRSGFTLLEVVVALALLGVLSALFAGYLTNMFRMVRKAESRMSVIELRHYIHDNAGCARTFLSYVTPNGDTSACRFPSTRALVLRKDGTQLISDVAPTRIQAFEVQARCLDARTIEVDFRNAYEPGAMGRLSTTIRKKTVVMPPAWKPLFRGAESLCDEGILQVGHSGWGPGVVAPAIAPEMAEALGGQTIGGASSATGIMARTSAQCAPYRNFFSGFANCPSGQHVYEVKLACPMPGHVYSSVRAESGVFGVCCGGGGMISAACSANYEIKPSEAGQPLAPTRIMTRTYFYGKVGMVSTNTTCRGPDPGDTYNLYTASLSCPFLVREAHIDCGTSGTRLMNFTFTQNTVTGWCCSRSGSIDLTCNAEPRNSTAVADGGGGGGGGTPAGAAAGAIPSGGATDASVASGPTPAPTGPPLPSAPPPRVVAASPWPSVSPPLLLRRPVRVVLPFPVRVVPPPSRRVPPGVHYPRYLSHVNQASIHH